MRKPVHTSLVASSVDGHLIAVATCDDGTLWVFSTATKQWDRMPSIPQDTHPTTPTRGSDE